MEASLADACRLNKMATVDAYILSLVSGASRWASMTARRFFQVSIVMARFRRSL